jgi:hypothetical protein
MKVLTGLRTNPRMNLLFVWAGPAFVVLYSAGMILGQFFPPTDPQDSAIKVAHFFSDHKTTLRIGCILMEFGAAFIALWAVAIAAQMRRSEMGAPILTYAALGSAFFVAIDASLIPTLWAVLAFRPEDISPDITRTLNDLAWFLFLFPWQFGGGIWFLAVGLSILTDKSRIGAYPRWAGYACLWFCFATFPASLIAFFKNGPFAFNGLIAFYIPLSALFIWVIIMTYLSLATIKREAASEGILFDPTDEPEMVSSGGGAWST